MLHLHNIRFAVSFYPHYNFKKFNHENTAGYN